MSKSYIIKRSFIGLFLFFFQIISIFPQNIKSIKISNIEFVGNTKTQDFIIEREIKHPINAILDSNMVIDDRNRLDNLGIFSEVNWQITPLENGTAILIFTITESIQRTPPIAFPIYDEDTGWSLQGLWFVNNFRGRNQSLSVAASFGGKDTYGINIKDPWIFGDHVSFNLNIDNIKYKHRFLNRNIDLNSFRIGFGKWYGENIKSFLKFELESKLFKKEQKIDDYFYTSYQTSIKYDTRDIFWNPGKGILFSQNIYYMNGINPNKLNTTIWRQSYSWFITLTKFNKKLVFALNSSINRKFGNKNKYWLDYFGSSRNIRGWSLPDSNLYKTENFRFGHESFQTTIELRYEIIQKYATRQGIESGLISILFIDRGLINNHWRMLSNTLPMYGVGVGLRIPFPLVGVIHLDYGWGFRNGKWNTGALHFGFGQKF